LPNSVVLQVVEEDGKVIGTFTGRVQMRTADVEGGIAKEEEATGGVCLLLQWDRLVRVVRQILAGAEGETVPETQRGTEAKSAGRLVAKKVIDDSKGHDAQGCSEWDLHTQA
jgi:hypothetical protein